MHTNKITKKTLSVLLASTLVFSLVPSTALAAKADTAQQTTSSSSIEKAQPSTNDDGSKKQKDEQTKNEKKNDPVDEINETIDLGDDVKNETKPNETKEHKKNEVDKSKFVEPNYIQKEVDALLNNIASNMDPTTFIGVYVGGAIQRGIFTLGEELLNCVGTAVFGGKFFGEPMTANKVAFMLTELDAKAKVVVEESQDLVDLIKNEAKGSVLDDFNAHMSTARGMMLTLSGQYNMIACCEDKALKKSLIAQMNIERERTLTNLLKEKAQIDNYLLGEQSLTGKNIFQVFDSYVDAKYGFSADGYEIKQKFRTQVLAFVANLSKYVAIPRGDTRIFSPFAGQIEKIKENNARVQAVVDANIPQNLKKSFHINAIGKDVEFGTPAIVGNYWQLRKEQMHWSVRKHAYDRYYTFNLKGFNEDHTKHGYFSKGRDIETPLGLGRHVEFFTNDKNADYCVGETFDQKYVSESEFNKLLSKKPANMKVQDWIERAAGLKEGTCPKMIILGESLDAYSEKLDFFAPCVHEFKYRVYDVKNEKFFGYSFWIKEASYFGGTTDPAQKISWECYDSFVVPGDTLHFGDFFRDAKTLTKLDKPAAK